MYNKSYIKKWVGLFLLVFTIFFGINSNVYAETKYATAECENAVKAYNVSISNDLTTKEKLTVKVYRSSEMDGKKTKFYVRILTSKPDHDSIVKKYIKNYNKYNGDSKSKDYNLNGYTNKISFGEIKDKNGNVTGYNTSASKKYSLKKLKELVGDDIEEFYILVYTNEGSCTEYYYSIYKISYIKENDIIGNVTSAYLNEIANRTKTGDIEDRIQKDSEFFRDRKADPLQLYQKDYYPGD